MVELVPARARRRPSAEPANGTPMARMILLPSGPAWAEPSAWEIFDQLEHMSVWYRDQRLSWPAVPVRDRSWTGLLAQGWPDRS